MSKHVEFRHLPANMYRNEYWRLVEARLWPSIIDKMEGQHRAFQLLEGASLQRPYPLTLQA